MASIPANPTTPDTVLLIHGLWMTPRSWEHWIDRYTRAGFRVLAPAWPGLEGEVEALRDDPAPIAELTVSKIVDHYDRIIRELDRPPIIIGHSFGGAFTQMLLDRGLGAAGVGIDSAAPKGVFRVPISSLKACLPVLRNPVNRHRAVPLSLDQFHYAFTNTMSRQDAERVYQRYAVPGAAHVLFEEILANLNPRAAIRVDYGNEERAPLLFIAGGADQLVPPAVNRANAGRYRKSPALTGYKEFPGRPHYTIGQAGWEEVADYAVNWAVEAARTRQPQQTS